ncbi:MAG: hypothetical protein LQ337_004069 [Flavoplaca oasis]|nr:MAG: hypothetical protein LQ337_004069 [Flavoplaca oasis]
MYPRSILLALVGSLAAFAVGHEESSADTCTTTATVSVTSSIPSPIAARSTTSIPPALPQTEPESVTSIPSTLDILSGSAFESAISSLVSAFPTGTNFGTVTAPDTTYKLSGTPITNPEDLSTPSTKSTIFLGTNTTLTASLMTSTSTSSTDTSKSTSTTSTKTSTSSASATTTAAAATSTTAQPASAASGLPGKSANLALAVVAGAMLLL